MHHKYVGRIVLVMSESPLELELRLTASDMMHMARDTADPSAGDCIWHFSIGDSSNMMRMIDMRARAL